MTHPSRNGDQHMNEIVFIEKSTLGDPWFLEVRSGPAIVGHIRGQRAHGPYRYFPGKSNVLNPSFEGPSLDVIKERVARNPSGQTLGN